MTFGGLGGSLEGLGLIFNGFGAPFWSPLRHHFEKNRDLDHACGALGDLWRSWRVLGGSRADF